MNPVAVSMVSGRDDLDLVRQEYAAPVDESLTEMRRAHGYRIQPRIGLPEPWFGDVALLADYPNLLAISSTGAGYDMIDVEDFAHAGVIVLNLTPHNAGMTTELMLEMVTATAQRWIDVFHGQVPWRMVNPQRPGRFIRNVSRH